LLNCCLLIRWIAERGIAELLIADRGIAELLNAEFLNF
jgi:hypothetical protein